MYLNVGKSKLAYFKYKLMKSHKYMLVLNMSM